MLKRKVEFKAEKKGFLGQWKKVDNLEKMEISENKIKDIEVILAENKSLHDIFSYVKKYLPTWNIFYLHKEDKHLITLENESSTQRIVFEVEKVKQPINNGEDR